MSATVDAMALRDTVQDYWRGFITLATSNPKEALRLTARFDARVKIAAEELPTGQSQAFIAAIEQVRDDLAEEYFRNPDAQRRRLGLPAARRQSYQHGRRGMGEMAMRTAIRATIWSVIWETIRALFRL